MEKVSIFDIPHQKPVESKQVRLIRVYLGYSRYCADVAKEYDRQGNRDMAAWYRKEAQEYMLLAGELEASL